MPVEFVTGAAADANVAGQPVNLMLYGPPGTLKTTDAVKAFTSPFVIPCEDNALKIVRKRGIKVPGHVKTTVKSWVDMYHTFDQLYRRRNEFSAAILDGFTPFTTYLYKEAEEQHKGNKNKYVVPVQVRLQLFTLREWIRALGLHFVYIAHPLPPAVQDNVFYPGGFSMQPKSIIGDYFGQIDTVMRVDHIQMLGQAPIRAYFTGGTDWPDGVNQPFDWRQWRTKNREGCSAAIVPADLAAFLRQAGYERL